MSQKQRKQDIMYDDARKMFLVYLKSALLPIFFIVVK
jgi:hypothetical protein